MHHKNNGSDYDLIVADSRHALGMARCHSVSFPGRFMTEMGQRWLAGLYRFFIDHDRGISYVAVNGGGQVIGFAVGGGTDIRKQFLRYALLRFPHIILLKFVCKSLVRRTLLTELARKTRPKKNSVQAGMAMQEDTSRCGNLLSICVSPEYRGTAVAGKLIEAFVVACAKKGYDRLLLSVVRENERAINFYKKHGWRRVDRSGQSERFMIVLNRDTEHSTT